MRLTVTRQELMKSLARTRTRFLNIRQDTLDTLFAIQNAPDIETQRPLKTRLRLLVEEGHELLEQCKQIENVLYPTYDDEE